MVRVAGVEPAAPRLGGKLPRDFRPILHECHAGVVSHVGNLAH